MLSQPGHFSDHETRGTPSNTRFCLAQEQLVQLESIWRGGKPETRFQYLKCSSSFCSHVLYWNLRSKVKAWDFVLMISSCLFSLVPQGFHCFNLTHPCSNLACEASKLGNWRGRGPQCCSLHTFSHNAESSSFQMNILMCGLLLSLLSGFLRTTTRSV